MYTLIKVNKGFFKMKSILKKMESGFFNFLSNLYQVRLEDEVKEELSTEPTKYVFDRKNLTYSVRKKIDAYREASNITMITNPNYKEMELGLLFNNYIDSLVLKYRISEDNVNDREKRLITIKAYFYDCVIPSELVLIDTRTIEYINYYKSRLVMDSVSREYLTEFKPDKGFTQDPFILSLFTAVIRHYESTVRSEFILPVEFLVHKFASTELESRIDSIDRYNTVQKMVMSHLTIYSILYGIEIPEDYILLNKDVRTNMFYIENLLSNIEHEVDEVDESKVRHLSLVK